MAYIVKIGRHTEDEAMGAINEIDEERFEDAREAERFAMDYLGRGYRANVYEGSEHLGSYEL